MFPRAVGRGGSAPDPAVGKGGHVVCLPSDDPKADNIDLTDRVVTISEELDSRPPAVAYRAVPLVNGHEVNEVLRVRLVLLAVDKSREI